MQYNATRFWSHVQVGSDDECWPWLGCKDKWGYGVIRVNGRLKRAHRVAYELSHGPIQQTTDKACVLHSCDHPDCVNPSHLRIGTDFDNMQDKVNRNRQAKGPHNGRSKLTEDQVIWIRSQVGVACRSLARMFRVDPKAIRSIRQGKTWKYLLSPN